MKRRVAFALAALAAFASPMVLAATDAPIPKRPEQLRYEPLKWEPPAALKHRHVLSNGVVVFVVEDHALPLVNVGISLRIGTHLDPAGKTGLAEMTGRLLRRGGAGDLGAEAFDERADFLAAQIASFTGPTGGGASLNAITPVLEESLALFFDMLERPRFEQARLDLERNLSLEQMKQRNDDAGDILAREWQWLLRGEEHFTSRFTTQASLQAITRDDLVAFHRQYWNPKNMVIGVSGDVETKTILALLEKHFAEGFAQDATAAPWPPPPPAFTPKAGIYRVEKDIPQSKVLIGHLGARWSDWSAKDPYALRVMSHVLGDSGFTSRITKKVRSDEGLAYSARSNFEVGTYWPGIFNISFQTKNETVALAAKLSLAEVRRIQDEPISEQELETARNSLVESLPLTFSSASGTVNTFVQDVMLGRPHEYWKNYRDRVRAVTIADVQRVAKQYLRADETVFLVVGPWEQVLPGDPNGRASMKEFGLERVTELPLRDPMTMTPLAR